MFPICCWIVLLQPWNLLAQQQADHSDASPQTTKTEVVIADHFSAESAQQYEVSGNVVWQDGELMITPGASIRRSLDAGWQTRVELDVQFPEPSNELPATVIGIRFELAGATDCLVAIKIESKRNGSVQNVVSVWDTTSNADQPKRLIREFVHQSKSSRGNWVIEYSAGKLTIVDGAMPNSVFAAHIMKGFGEVIGFAVSSEGGDVALHRLQVAASAASVALTESQRQQLESANQLNHRAVQHYYKGETKQALDLSNQAIQIREHVLGSGHPLYAQSLANLGALADQEGDLRRSEQIRLKAKELMLRLVGNDHPEYAGISYSLARTYAKLAEFQRAEPLFLESKAIYEKVYGKNHTVYAICVNGLGSLYEEMGDYAGAESLYREAMTCHKNAKQIEHGNYASAVNNLALLLDKLGDLPGAIELYEQSKSIFARLYGTEHPAYAATIDNLAGLYLELDQPKRAEPLYREAMSIRKSMLGDQHPAYALSLNNLSAFYRAMGDADDAETLQLEALEIYRNVYGTEHPQYAVALSNLAKHHVSNLDFHRAEKTLKESKAINENRFGPDHPETARSLADLAALYRIQGKLEQTIPLLKKVVAIREKTLGPKHPKLAEALNQLSELHHLVGNDQESISLLKQSLEITRDTLERYSVIQTERQQRDFSTSLRTRMFRYLSVITQQESPDRDAFTQSLAWKGATLLRQIQYRDLATNPNTSRLFRQLRTNASQIAHHLRKDPVDSRWKQRYAQLDTQRDELERQLARASAAFDDVDRQVTIDALVRELPANAVLIDYLAYIHLEPDSNSPGRFQSEYRCLAFVLRRDGEEPVVNAIQLGPMKPIEREISSWRSAMKRGSDRKLYEESGRVLRQLIWEPIARYIGEKDLVIICPDGVIGSFPVAALPGQSPGSFLLEDYRLATIPVPRLITQSTKPQRIQTSVQKTGLLIGGVDYGEGQNRVMPGTRLPFTQLQETHTEVEGIATLLEDSTVLTGVDADESTFLDQLDQHNIVHIATHGFFRSPKSLWTQSDHGPQKDLGQFGNANQRLVGENPGFLTGIALSGANEASTEIAEQDDGILYSAEVAMLPLRHLDLVVLSACDTGLGQSAEGVGEGLIGMQRAFQIAGAKTTITSLWKVNDRATQRLMIRFYDNWINSKMSKFDAFREAQLWMLRSPIAVNDITRGDPIDLPLATVTEAVDADVDEYRAHPRYWAAWVLSGDWR